MEDRAAALAPDRDGLLALALLAAVVGAGSGVVGAAFRLALERADGWRSDFVAWAHGWPAPGIVVVVAATAAASAFAAWLVRRFAQYAGGSGIPHVEAVVRGELPHASASLLPVKFVGGWLAIGSGLALGREGPSVQMGACLGSVVGARCRRDAGDRRVLLAAGAGAGLATAFNAPTAGAVFVLEELVRRFETRIAIAALAASASAIAVARLLLGVAPDFSVAPFAPVSFGQGVPFVAVGLLAGLVGVAYNHTVLGALRVADAARALSAPARGALVGALVGVIAYGAPNLVGGGDALTQEALDGRMVFATLPLVFAVRFTLGAVSYAAGTPGGLFAPLLVLGAQLGSAWAWCAEMTVGPPALPAPAYALVGMAAFFTAVVRAPLTGIVLVTEMTDTLAMLLPMVIASALAMLVATLLGNPPIYDSLRERLLRT